MERLVVCTGDTEDTGDCGGVHWGHWPVGVCPSMGAVTPLKRQGHGRKHMPDASWPQSCKPCFLSSVQI